MRDASPPPFSRWDQLGANGIVSELREWASIREFVTLHSLKHLPAEPQWILTDLIAGPEKILLLRDGEIIAGIAAVVDTCENSTSSAEVLVLAALPEALTAESLEALLYSAEGVAARGPRQRLEMAVTPAVKAAREGLIRRQYRREHVVFDLRLDPVAPHRTMVPLPPELHWEDPTLADAHDFHKAVTAAFEGQPAVGLAPFDAFRAAFEKHQDCSRLLKAEHALVGFVRWAMASESVGRIDILGRIPSYRGRKLGVLLLDEALRQLGQRGADVIEMQVAAENYDAVELYRSVGFAIVDQTESYLKDL